MIRFTMDFSENGQAGEYQITSVQFTQEKTKQEILLSDLGMTLNGIILGIDLREVQDTL